MIRSSTNCSPCLHNLIRFSETNCVCCKYSFPAYNGAIIKFSYDGESGIFWGLHKVFYWQQRGAAAPLVPRFFLSVLLLLVHFCPIEVYRFE